ncbi:MAG: hypothetical protein ACOC8N_07460, partial [Spirochaetota bacterium]
MYDKSIVLLQDRRTAQYLKLFLGKRNKEVDTSSPLLSDIEAVRNELYVTRNTSNIRVAFGQFIKNHGFPFLVALDYTVDFGLKEQEDPDRRKVLRTILISYIILANAKGFDRSLANIVLLCGKKDAHLVEVYRNNPSILLKQLRTNDERVNALIRSHIQKGDELRRFLNLFPLVRPTDGDYHGMLENLGRYVDLIEKELKQARGGEGGAEPEGRKPARPTPEMNTQELPPADVICRATLDKIVVNGEVRPITEEERERYHEKVIVLEGAITVRTVTMVNERILDLFKVIARFNPFRKNERIFIRVPDESVIDGSFASSVGSF